jgi:hypothetical protein
MTDFAPIPNTDGLTKLSGTIKNLKITRGSASFVFTSSDQTKLGILAVASALAGLDGQAATAAHYSSDLEEPADYLEFELGGQLVKGWVWRNPFKEGDSVDVAADKTGAHWEVFGIARPSDRMVALYPHCSRGRISHYKNALKWWGFGWGGFTFVVEIPILFWIGGVEIFKEQGSWIMLGGLMAFFGVMTFFLTRQWLPFVRVAEKVFRALELPNPSSIDLVKSSKAQSRPDDPGEYGTFYFRY